MMASPPLLAATNPMPGGRSGEMGLPVPLAKPQTTSATNGTITMTWMTVSALPVRSRPRMLMKVKKATKPMPSSQRQLSLMPHLLWM
jgi:hypothetical protein